MSVYGFVFVVLNTLILAIYLKDFFNKSKMKCLLPVVLGVITAVIIALLLNEFGNRTYLYYIASFAMLFSILPAYYAIRTRVLVLSLFVAFSEFIYTTYIYGALLYPFIQMFAIGTMYGILYRNGFNVLNRTHSKRDKRLEIRRDLVHILLGIIIFAIFTYLSFYNAVYLTTLLIFAGYTYNSVLGSNGSKKSNVVYRLLSSFERSNALYGLGALYLGIGVALMLGFIHNLHFVLIGVTALLLADPIATIVGSSFKSVQLFYNKKKSLAGSAAFFLVVSIVGYPLIGSYSLLFGLALAFVESLDSPLDDNIGIALVMIVLYFVFLAVFPH